MACRLSDAKLSQHWLIANWSLRNELKWNLNQNKKNFVNENAFENVVYEMAATLSREKWVNEYMIQHPSVNYPSLLNISTRTSFMGESGSWSDEAKSSHKRIKRTTEITMTHLKHLRFFFSVELCLHFLKKKL